MSQGFNFLKERSTVPGMAGAVELVEKVSEVAGDFLGRVRQASLQALADGSHGDTPALSVAQRVVGLARYAEPQGGIGETDACEPTLVAVLEGMKAHVQTPEVLDKAIADLQRVKVSTELPLGRSSRQAIIAHRALKAARPF